MEKNRKIKCRQMICLTILFIVSGLVDVFAETQAKKTPENPDIHVMADKLVSDRNAQYAEFSGNVVATREDAKLTCANLKIFYKEKDAGGASSESGAVDKMVATGSVKLIFEDKVAVAEKAVYTSVDDSIILTGGEPKVTGGNSYISGEKITLYRTAGKVLVSNRVEAVFHPADKALTEKQEKLNSPATSP